MSADLRLGDCLEVMRTLDEASVDAVICDPPYALTAGKKGGTGIASGNLKTPYGRSRITAGNGPGGFMGQRWDAELPGPEVWAEVLRVAKPGAHLLAFGGPRTSHRLVCAIEDGGWEIRDSLSWLYGSGFPKSMDVERAIAEMQCQEPGRHFWSASSLPTGDKAEPGDHVCEATPDSLAWDGYGTALKPGWEPIALARKPLIGTVAANVTQHGTGGLNVDGCRIEGPEGDGQWGSSNRECQEGRTFNASPGGEGFRSERHPEGRWPANVILDAQAADLLDAQSGERPSGIPGIMRLGENRSTAFGAESRPSGTPMTGYGDTGGASRFFYTAKAPRSEREAGLVGPASDRLTPMAGRGQPGLKCRRCGRWKVSGNPCDCPEPEFEPSEFERPDSRNTHPTVKPLDLMRWLCRLITPHGGLILDPYMGSGSTGCAAVLEGFRFLGIEREAAYLPIAQQRIAYWANMAQPDLFPATPRVR